VKLVTETTVTDAKDNMQLILYYEMCIANGIITSVGQIIKLEDRIGFTKYCVDYMVFNEREDIIYIQRIDIFRVQLVEMFSHKILLCN